MQLFILILSLFSISHSASASPFWSSSPLFKAGKYFKNIGSYQISYSSTGFGYSKAYFTIHYQDPMTAFPTQDVAYALKNFSYIFDYR